MYKMKQRIKAVMDTLINEIMRFIWLFYETLCNLSKKITRKAKAITES